MAASPTSKAALEARVWRTMFDLLMRSAPARTASLGRRGLTPNDARALGSLDVRKGRPMRALAELWRCDPSYATWIVDRLEKLGLAERRAAPADRRVKLVVLTKKGARTRAQLLEEFHRPPPEIAALERADLEALDVILTRARGSS
jgi:MarR family transcriptional regulator, organic hydroperoxide resistance regulator